VNTQPILEEPILEFDLREDARWHDGSEVTAVDVQSTLEAVLASPWGLPDKGLLRAVRTVEAGQGRQVRVIYWQHVGPALFGWVGLPIVQAAWWQGHVAERSPAVFRQSPPLGAGAWVVDETDYRSMVLRSVTAGAGARLTLVRNFSAFTVQLGYRTQMLDLFWPNAPELPATLRGEKLLTLPSPTRRGLTLWLNARRGPLAQPDVRKAMAQVIDREELAHAWPASGARAHHGLFVPGLWGDPPSAEPVVSQTEAERVLAAAGWIRNVNGVVAGPQGSLVLTLSVTSGSPALNQTAALLTTRWRALGVQVLPRFATAEVQKLAVKQGEFDIVLREAPLGRSWDLMEQHHSLSPGNVSGYGERQLDFQLEALAAEFDPVQARDRVRAAERAILAGHAIVPLLSLQDQAVLRSGMLPATPPAVWSLIKLRL
jgi:ABC-type transport system substrate-binding protein